MNNEKVSAKRPTNFFRLRGIPVIDDYTFDLDQVSSSGYVYSRLNLKIDLDNGDRVVTEMMGGYFPNNPKDILAHGKSEDGTDDFYNLISVPWEKRNDPETLEDIGEGCFIKIGLNKDYSSNNNQLMYEYFLSEYDAIQYLYENKDMIGKVSISGNMEYQLYNGVETVRKKIRTISITSREGCENTFVQGMYIKDKCIENKEDEIIITGYIPSYIKEYNGIMLKKSALIPAKFHVLLNEMKSEEIDNVKKIISKYFATEKGFYTKISIEGRFREGLTTRKLTIDDLDNDTKYLIYANIISLEEATSMLVGTGTNRKIMEYVRPRIIRTTTEDGATSLRVDVQQKAYKIQEVLSIEDIEEEYEYNAIQPEESVEKKAEKKEEIKTGVRENSIEEELNDDKIDIDSIFDDLPF